MNAAAYNRDAGDAFSTRLKLLTGLEEAAVAEIAALREPGQKIKAYETITRESDRADRLHVLLEGWAGRIRSFPDGKRQITMVLLPGDICNLDDLHLSSSEGDLEALSGCRLAVISGAALRDLAAQKREIADALGRLYAVENGMLAERNASLGRRLAQEHLAHLFCELFVRLKAIGQAQDSGYSLPLTQTDIGDVTGLTAVHVNRSLQALRAEGLIELRGRQLAILDWGALRKFAEFDPSYLHLGSVGV